MRVLIAGLIIIVLPLAYPPVAFVYAAIFLLALMGRAFRVRGGWADTGARLLHLHSAPGGG
jgi:hypothetical protein